MNIPKFKNGQKVVSIKNVNGLNINKIYCIAGNTTDNLVRKCADKKYIEDNINNTIYYFIIDENEYEYRNMFNEEYFMSLKEYRKEKLNKINEK